MNGARYATVLVAAVAIGGCTGTVQPTPVAAPAVTTTSSSSATTTPLPATPVTVEYPSMVAATYLPPLIRDIYQDNGWAIAIALAPGVWTPLPDGKLAADQIEAGPLTGWCKAIDTFDEAHPGHTHPRGACW